MKITLSLALLATTLVSNATGSPLTARAKDVCNQFGNNGEWVLWDKAMNCLESFPFNTTIRDEVLDYVEKTLQFYVFLDEAKNFDKKYSSHVDLIAGLEKIRQTNYTNDYSFNVAIETLFDSLNDGHTTYWNRCYTPGDASWNFRLPFPIVGLSDGDKLRFYVVNAYNDNSPLWDSDMPDYLKAFKKYTNIDPAIYVGSEVIAIDGRPVLDVIKEFADSEVSISRDPSTRLNIALANSGPYNTLGAFTQRIKTKKPANATVTYTLLPIKKTKTKTITAPWLALAPPISSSADYWSNTCLYSSGESGGADLRSRHSQLQHKPKAKRGVNSVAPGLINPLVPCDSSIPGVTFLMGISWGCFSQLDNETAVLAINQFMEPPKGSLEVELKDGFQQLEKLKLTKLIIDFSENDGGYLLNAYELLNYLFPKKPTELYFPTDIRINPLVPKLAAAAAAQNQTGSFWHYSSWADPTTGKAFTSANQFPGTLEEFTRGGVKGKYSARFIENFELNLKPSTTFRYKPSDVIFFSNGFSFSAGALSARYFQDVVGVKTVVIGGYPGQPQAVSTTAGGQIYEIDGDISYLGLAGDPDAPKQPSVVVTVDFTIREAYGHNQPVSNNAVPLEFDWEPATYKIALTSENVFRPDVYWKQVKALMENNQ
ncbi:hypothetical protein BC937DRAFT_88614 [Endogone sp. FLAS-F59071]|nr:hypothetical protein BC937DRAFT_88614 [Endogone sp. FLAS-F59071]|eukprot:RUS22521.1 hypothetical protein BC937DRAFT_88614 [Endogone sp. FLAS-F59071]